MEFEHFPTNLQPTKKFQRSENTPFQAREAETKF